MCKKQKLTIKISGPGGCISNEVHLINKLLKDHGYEVDLIDKHPPEKEFDEKNIDGSYYKVTLIADHMPWGG